MTRAPRSSIQATQAVRAALARPGAAIALTGAGVSAESGIPTFRGKDGLVLVLAYVAFIATAAVF